MPCTLLGVPDVPQLTIGGHGLGYVEHSLRHKQQKKNCCRLCLYSGKMARPMVGLFEEIMAGIGWGAMSCHTRLADKITAT